MAYSVRKDRNYGRSTASPESFLHCIPTIPQVDYYYHYGSFGADTCSPPPRRVYIPYPSREYNYTNRTYRLPCSFSAVLVAHKGFAYDFPLLLAEIERRPGQLTTSSFHDLNISFADSLIYVQQVSDTFSLHACSK